MCVFSWKLLVNQFLKIAINIHTLKLKFPEQIQLIANSFAHEQVAFISLSPEGP